MFKWQTSSRKMISHRGLVLVYLSLIVLVQQVSCLDSYLQSKLYDTVHSAAIRLESAEMQLQEKSEALKVDYINLLRTFVREIKSEICEYKYKEVTDLVGQFKEKAYALLKEKRERSNQGWFSIPRWMGMTTINSLRGIARFNQHLIELPNQYEVQGDEGRLSEVIIECDMIKVLLLNLQSIMFILNTDVKYLVTEEPRTVGRIIYDKLVDQGFSSPINYDQVKLSQDQKDILLRYYGQQADFEHQTVGQVVDHLNPVEYIEGRLFNSCHKVTELRFDWESLRQDFNYTCKESRDHPLDAEKFEGANPFDRFDELFEFCNSYVSAV